MKHCEDCLYFERTSDPLDGDCGKGFASPITGVIFYPHRALRSRESECLCGVDAKEFVQKK